MLLLLRNRPLTWLKIAASTTRPSTAGSAPGSPDRRRSTYERVALATVRRSTSSEKSPAGRPGCAGRPAASALVCGVVMTRAPSDALVDGRRRQSDIATASGSDQLDDLRRAALLGVHHCRDPPEVEGGDAVGDLHDVVHVVRDEDDAEALVGQPPHQVEDLPGLCDAERSGRFVEEDDLAVPEDGFGDGDGLPLPPGQARGRPPAPG